MCEKEINLFGFESYKSYLKQWIQAHPNQGYGIKSKIAKVIQCNPAYLTSILSSGAHLSLEQGKDLCGYLNFDEEACDYFLTLILYEKAASEPLKEHFKLQLQKFRQSLSSQPEPANLFTGENQFDYPFLLPVINSALENQSLRNPEAMADFLGLALKETELVLKRMVSEGKAYENPSNTFFATSNHLPYPSFMIKKLLMTAWRNKAIQHLRKRTATDSHESTLLPASAKDIQKIQAILKEAHQKIAESMKKMPSSSDKQIYCLNLDLFQMNLETGFF